MSKTQTEQVNEISNRNVSMHSRNWAVVDAVNDRFAFGNVSAALRYIITEYARLSQLEAELQQTN